MNTENNSGLTYCLYIHFELESQYHTLSLTREREIIEKLHLHSLYLNSKINSILDAQKYHELNKWV